MSFFFSWFSKKPDSEDYEQVLASLASDIQKRQSRLSDIRIRERRSTLSVTLWTLAIWVAYVSAWYTSMLPNLSGHAQKSGFEKAVKGAPVVVGPIIILFTRRIVQLWYTRKANAEEKTLKTALKEQRTKIEEIKKKTNYYNTRNLLERYDESPSVRPGGPGGPNAPQPQNASIGPRGSSGPSQGSSRALQAPMTPQRPGTSIAMANGGGPPQTPMTSSLQSQLKGTPQPFQPMRKQWYDKVADALLGDDESPTSVSASRYALICEKCFNHNGLVKESMWEDAQYVCPKCGHFNASARSKKLGSISSPSSPISASPTSAASRRPRQSHNSPLSGASGFSGVSAASSGGASRRSEDSGEEEEGQSMDIDS
ncbi:hypothetical protein FIBSPDRAFT_803056 [Athelia psychrophila]|uniref:Endoplasmic reticulum junction formation protein lunapark n=1 Tax=Athelia psychrophila TaxID=1759441 RepID=A0A165XBM6_9AGAM|nr:hypothetical protein FIBSPDRAFT_803056 [Fibularhizoctonia sp. CBS 109695]